MCTYKFSSIASLGLKMTKLNAVFRNSVLRSDGTPDQPSVYMCLDEILVWGPIVYRDKTHSTLHGQEIQHMGSVWVDIFTRNSNSL